MKGLFAVGSEWLREVNMTVWYPRMKSCAWASQWKAGVFREKGSGKETLHSGCGCKEMQTV